MKKIPLTQGKFAIVDNEDFYELSRYKWHFNSGYAVRSIYDKSENGRQKVIAMHRVIAGTQPGMDTDHINHDKLDNRRSNLRACSSSENQQNRRFQVGRSGFYGVYKNGSGWVVRMRIEKKLKNFGTFKNIIDAVNEYKRISKQTRGRFALTNEICFHDMDISKR